MGSVATTTMGIAAAAILDFKVGLDFSYELLRLTFIAAWHRIVAPGSEIYEPHIQTNCLVCALDNPHQLRRKRCAFGRSISKRRTATRQPQWRQSAIKCRTADRKFRQSHSRAR